MHRQVGVDGQRHRRDGNGRDRLQVLLQVKALPHAQRRVDCHGVVADQHRVAIRLGARDVFASDVARCARAVFHHERCAKLLAQAGR
ncbi:hypothetical protein D3C85_1530590 [compost metagenome]